MLLEENIFRLWITMQRNHLPFLVSVMFLTAILVDRSSIHVFFSFPSKLLTYSVSSSALKIFSWVKKQKTFSWEDTGCLDLGWVYSSQRNVSTFLCIIQCFYVGDLLYLSGWITPRLSGLYFLCTQFYINITGNRNGENKIIPLNNYNSRNLF